MKGSERTECQSVSVSLSDSFRDFRIFILFQAAGFARRGGGIRCACGPTP